MDPSRPLPTTQALAAIDFSDRTDRTVTLDDVELDLRYAPEPGVDLRIETGPADARVVATTFAEAAERPASYPPELPYLPGAKAMIAQPPGRPAQTVSWFVLPDPEGALASIRAQTLAAGWTDTTEPGDPLPPGVRMMEFTRSGRGRMLVISSAGGITLADEAE